MFLDYEPWRFTVRKKQPAPAATKLSIGQYVEWITHHDNSDGHYSTSTSFTVQIHKGRIISLDAGYAMVEIEGWLWNSLSRIEVRLLHTYTVELRLRIGESLGRAAVAS